MIAIGEKIKKARKEKKLTQEELADNNISRSLISLIENGLSYPSMQTLEYLATKLDKHISYFLVENDSDSISLIADLEFLLDTEEYGEIINKAENFIKYKLNNAEDIKKQYLGILYCILGIASYKTNNKLAFEYLISSVDYLKSEGNNRYISKAYNYLGLVMYKNKDYEQMEYYLNLADSNFSIVTYDNINQKLNILYNLSLAYYYQRKYSLTADILLEALLYSKKHELYYSFGEFNMLLALSYKNMDKIDSAIECSMKAVKYYKLTENKYMEHRTYINLSIFFRVCNDYYNALNYINDAIIYFQSINDEAKLINAKVEKIISIFVINKDDDSILEMVDNVINNPSCNDIAKGELLTIHASLKLKNKDYQGALSMFHAAENLIHNYGDTEVYVFIFDGLITIYHHLNDIIQADIYQSKLEKLLQEQPYYEKYRYNMDNS
jgi:transcriptional regulator with XRE-family HTH domain